MTTRMQRYLAVGKLTGLAVIGIVTAYVLVYVLARLFGAAIAYADTGAPAQTGLTPTDIAAWFAALYAVAHAVLRIVAPMTKTKVDDDLLARLEALEGVVHRPPPITASGEVGGGTQ